MYENEILECAQCCIDMLNRRYNLEIDLKIIDEIYGMDLVNAIIDLREEVAENVATLVSLGLGDVVTDICNRYMPSLLEDNYIFAPKAEQLIQTLGKNYADKLGEDMGLFWEVMM